jgi:hypothetical protein
MAGSWLAFFIACLLQIAGVPFTQDDIFLPAEKAKIETEQNVEKRIKVYEAASKRIQKSMEASVRKDDFSAVPHDLQLWTALLSKSLEDIEANLKTKKKSRALIKYEIQVRKSIDRTESFKIRAPVDQQDVFDECIAKAEAIHEKFVRILFPH